MAEDTGAIQASVGPPSVRRRRGRLQPLVAVLRRYALWIGAATAVIVALYLALPLVLGPVVPAYSVRRQDLTATIVASGRVLTPYRVGVVAAVPVEEGQTVRKGQSLVVLQSDDLQAAVSQAQANVAQAQARLVQIARTALPTARQNRLQTQSALQNAELTYTRLSRLLAQDSVARADVDAAKRALDAAKAQDEAAALQVSTNAPGGPDEHLAQTQLQSAVAALAAARAKLAYAVIRAPADGVLIARNVERGDVVSPGMVLMTLSPAAQTQLLINVDEKNLGRVAVGQSALVSADAFADRRFPATVAYVNPGVDATTATVEVKLNVANPPSYLRQDMTVSVDIVSAERRGALAVPADALRPSASGGAYVLAVEGGRAVVRPVQTGIRGGGSVEILSGLTAADVVIPSTAKVRPGQRVRPRVHA